MKTSKTLSIILAFGCMLGMKNLSAQNTMRGGGGGFTFGYGFQDVSKLHDFVPADVKKFSKQHMLIGGTGHAFNGNFVIGGSGFGIVGDDISTDSFRYKLGGGMGTFDVGYLVYNSDKLKIYPLIGIGGRGYGMQIIRSTNINRTELMSNPAREINISSGGFVFDLSMNLNFIPMLNYDNEKNSYGGFMTGLQVGYLYSMPSSNWSFSGGEISGGPSFGLNMFYAKLIIGGFGMTK